MSGLVGALALPDLKAAMIIGLGTGSTAGWLGAVPGVERVDVVELEPAVLEVAAMCAEGNQDVLRNPKVHVTVGDAREALITTPNRYDLIFSEPSNPYRAGIASLYTREFYAACAQRLNPDGVFLQWLQEYGIDGQTVRTIYATLGSVFPEVQTWRTQTGDMLLMASRRPIVFDVPRTRERITREPFRSALAKVWRVTDLEGVLAQHIANAEFARAVMAAEKGRVNTDDQNVVEFGFARSVGREQNFGSGTVLELARERGEVWPAVAGGAVDWDAVEDRRVSSYAAEVQDAPMPPAGPNEPEAMRHRRRRAAALAHAVRGNWQAAVDEWAAQPRPPEDLTECLYLAGAFNETGRGDASNLIEKIRQYQPPEAAVLAAQRHWRQGRVVDAVESLEAALVAYRRDPWPQQDLMVRAHDLALEMTRADNTGNAGKRLYDAMREPYVMHLLQDTRLRTMLKIAAHVDARTGSRMAAEAAGLFEPHVPWEGEFLVTRANAYDGTPLAERAARELQEFMDAEPFPFNLDLSPPRPAQPGGAEAVR
jgi:hypothetical protein